jgi:photosynthetic reaction center cytochrome c subunit
MRLRFAEVFRSKPTVPVLSAGILFCCVLVFAQMPTPDPSKKSSEVYKNVQVLKDVPSDQLIPSMKFISSALGVHCEYCHVENTFDKDDKKTKQTARKMMQMMFAINTNNFDGHQEVTCYSCHRGNPKPLAIPLIAESNPKLLNSPVPETQPNPPDLPKPEEIVQKYVAALGGADALSKLNSLSKHGSAELGGRQFQMDVMIKSPNRIATITHFPGGDSISTWDGKAGWMLFPGSPVRAMAAADVDAARMDADLHFALDLKTAFTELQVERKMKIADKDTIMLVGKRPGMPPVELYFDAQTGLLVRIVRYESSALGLNPNQIDYSDYRDVAGVKIPFHLTSTFPTGRSAVQIATAEPNAAIRDDVFSKPSPPPASQ